MRKRNVSMAANLEPIDHHLHPIACAPSFSRSGLLLLVLVLVSRKTIGIEDEDEDEHEVAFYSANENPCRLLGRGS